MQQTLLGREEALFPVHTEDLAKPAEQQPGLASLNCLSHERQRKLRERTNEARQLSAAWAPRCDVGLWGRMLLGQRETLNVDRMVVKVLVPFPESGLRSRALHCYFGWLSIAFGTRGLSHDHCASTLSPLPA